MEPIHFAESVPVALRLLRAGAVLDSVDKHGMQPIHYAAFWGNLEVAQLLMEQRADAAARVGTGSYAGDLPVHLAAEAGHLGTVKALVAQVSGMICSRGHGGRSIAEA